MRQNEKNCVYCGATLPETSQLYKRKYCSVTCCNKFRLRTKKPGVQAKLWQHEPRVFADAMEMHWDGEESGEIARRLGIPVGTVYSWVHDFGNLKQRKGPLKQLLRVAKSPEEWLAALRVNTIQGERSFEDLPVILVCTTFQGQSAAKRSAFIYESLKGIH